MQTEDLGLHRQRVDTRLLTADGRVIKSVRTSYADVVYKGNATDIVSRLAIRQHNLMAAALLSGKFDMLIDDVLLGQRGGDNERLAPSCPKASGRRLHGSTSAKGEDADVDAIVHALAAVRELDGYLGVCLMAAKGTVCYAHYARNADSLASAAVTSSCLLELERQELGNPVEAMLCSTTEHYQLIRPLGQAGEYTIAVFFERRTGPPVAGMQALERIAAERAG